jgi:dolichol-phosphate mannosyltransferase
VDIFSSAPRPLRFEELAYEFRSRKQGESKLDSAVIAEFGLLLCDKTVGRYLPTRFLAFLLVGMAGMVVHMTILMTASRAIHLPFAASQMAATAVAIVGNYSLNNMFTFRDRRRRGRAFWVGLMAFSLACGVGALISYQLAKTLLDSGVALLLAGAAGAFVGGIWNFNMTSFFVWHSPVSRTPPS